MTDISDRLHLYIQVDMTDISDRLHLYISRLI